VTPNGFDPTIFRPDRAAPSPRAKDGPLKVIVVSRLSPEKDPLTAAEGIAAFARAGGQVAVTFVGDGPLRRSVENCLQASPAEVELISTHLPHDRLSELYRASDLLILTSPREGSNQVVLEAMGCGTPVLATDVRGINDVVGDAGLLVPARNAQAIAEALGKLVDNPTLMADLRARGLDRARKFTWDAIAERMDHVYSAVVPRTA
jgi:glycosyltransferase involved in cell wall biosynthesis